MTNNMKNKVIIIDGGVMSMKSIFSWGSTKLKILNGTLPESTFLPPVSYTFFLMCISALKKIGINEGDKIILACDKTNSWRKFFYPEYKAQRKGMRDDATHIDFPFHFSVLDKFIDQMDKYSDWNIMWLPKMFKGADLLFSLEGEKFFDVDEYTDDDTLNKWFGMEADDLIAYASEYYTDKEVIFISIDADLDQLCVRDNTKFFTLAQKYKGSSGLYKYIKNGYDTLAKKIEKGDVADNIIPGETDDNSERAIKLRELIIDLINFPTFIKDKLKPVFDELEDKELDLENLPFQQSLAKRYLQIYEKKNILTVEQCEKYFEKKDLKKKKKAKEKREAKKLEKQELSMRS